MTINKVFFKDSSRFFSLKVISVKEYNDCMEQEEKML